jgi:hypothetical protein
LRNKSSYWNHLGIVGYAEIHFNIIRGLEHLKFKRRGITRSEQDQYTRFKLLDLAPQILKLSRTLQGYQETKGFERVRIHGRTENRLVRVRYYEFIAILKEVRLKVIIKQIDNGERFFWSLIPFWRAKKQGQTREVSRKLYEGNPEED